MLACLFPLNRSVILVYYDVTADIQCQNTLTTWWYIDLIDTNNYL